MIPWLLETRFARGEIPVTFNWFSLGSNLGFTTHKRSCMELCFLAQKCLQSVWLWLVRDYGLWFRIRIENGFSGQVCVHIQWDWLRFKHSTQCTCIGKKGHSAQWGQKRQKKQQQLNNRCKMFCTLKLIRTKQKLIFSCTSSFHWPHTEIFQQLLDGLPWNLVQTLMFSSFMDLVDCLSDYWMNCHNVLDSAGAQRMDLNDLGETLFR